MLLVAHVATAVEAAWVDAKRAHTDRCEVDSEMRMNLHPLAAPLGPSLKLGIRRQLASALEEFCHYAETGTPHQRKLDQS